MHSTARKVAERIRNCSEARICSHIDADGIAAAGIASLALDGVGVDNTVSFVKNLDEGVIEDLRNENSELVWFTDLGSGSLEMMSGLECVISDHHVPSFVNQSRILEVNPHRVGKDGALDISGAGTAYLVALALDKKNIDTAHLAILGAVGDMQDQNNLKLVGTNRMIMEDGKKAGVLDWKMDARFFGRETRPLVRLLQYTNDPLIPGLSGSWAACKNFLYSIGIELKNDEGYRRWIDLSSWEREKIISELQRTIIASGLGYDNAERLLGEVYHFPREAEGTELHEAKEFATLLNSCGRYEKASIGFALCKGDREEALDSALMLLKGHRGTLVDSLRVARSVGIERLEHIQYFHGGSKILDSVIGITAGMLLGSGEVESDIPLFAFANAEDGVKVSARGTRELVARGLDLSHVMKMACERFEGVGGGHNIAAGATIPGGTEDEFVVLANELVGCQLEKARITE
jgi:single-stranded-DNA-specific exonuclease